MLYQGTLGVDLFPYLFLYFFALVCLVSSLTFPGPSLIRINTIGLFLLMVFIAGFRFNVGIDFQSHSELFRYARNGYDVPIELAYKWFISILSLIDFSNQIVFILMSAMTLYFFYLFIRMHSSNILYSAFIFLAMPILYLSSLNISRQFVAVSIFAFALRYVVERKFLHYLFWISIATTFHKSAIALLPLYVALLIRPSFIYYSFAAVAYIALLPLIESIAPIIGVSSSYFLRSDEIEGVSLKVMVLCIIPLLMFIYSQCLRSMSNDADVFINISFFMVLLSISPAFISIPSDIFWRVLPYFFIAIPVQIVSIAGAISSTRLRLFYYFIISVGMTIYYFFTIIENGVSYKLIPYSANFFIFNLI